MRILVAASGGEGHLGPLLPFVAAARSAGDDVVLVIPPEQEQTARAAGVRYRVTDSPPADDIRAARLALESSDSEIRSYAAEVELFGRINTAAALNVTTATAELFEPDLILREPCDYASAVVATSLAIPMATVGISPGRADISGLTMAGEVIEPLAAGVTSLIESSPYLTRFPTDGDTGYPDTRRYGFPALGRERAKKRPPLVWLTMGTVNIGFDQTRGTWLAAVDALATLDVDVVASTGRGGVQLPTRDRLQVVEWIDLAEILARASAVVCHGGSGTTLAALAAGVPVVCVPMIADQPANAAYAENLSAGITVAPAPGKSIGGLTPDDVPRLRRAIEEVLENPAYRRGADDAADLLTSAPSVDMRLDEMRTAVDGDRRRQ